MEWYIGVLKKYAVFSGRARRTEYWMFTLFNLIICIGLQALSIATIAVTKSSALGMVFMIIYWLYALAVLCPAIAVTVRRLHDTGRSGWWYLIVFTCVGVIVLLVFMCLDGTPGENQFGPNPKEVAA